MINAWLWIHTFWTWGAAVFAVLATGADAVKGFKWTKLILFGWWDKMFGLNTFKAEINARFASTDAALQENYRLMTLIASEMTPNGGKSIKDVVNKIETRVNQIDARQVLNSERVRALSTDAPVGVQEFDADGKLIWANRTYLRMISRDLTEVLGYGWINSVLPEDRDSVKTDWLESVRQGSAYENEYRTIKPDGTITRISARATIMRSNDEVIGFVTSVFEAK
jgi:PAS domain S-box-containing protein